MIAVDPGAAPLSTRARLAHEPAETDPQTLKAQGTALIDAAVTQARTRLKTGLDTIRQETRQAGEALERMVTGKGTKADVAMASKVMKVVADATDQVAQQVAKGKLDIPGLLSKTLPNLVHAALPGVSVQGARKALTVASRLLQLAKNPSLKGLAGVVGALRGNPSARSRRGGLGDFLVSTTLSAMSGQPLTLSRFLPGALRAAGKDLRSLGISVDQQGASFQLGAAKLKVGSQGATVSFGGMSLSAGKSGLRVKP